MRLRLRMKHEFTIDDHEPYRHGCERVLTLPSRPSMHELLVAFAPYARDVRKAGIAFYAVLAAHLLNACSTRKIDDAAIAEQQACALEMNELERL